MRSQSDDEAKRIVQKRYDESASSYDASRVESVHGRRFTHRDVSLITRYLDLPKGAQVLEVGCGTGRLMVPLRSRGWIQLGVDASDSMLRRIQSKMDASPPGFELVLADAETLPFKTASFDGVYTLNVLHWLPNTVNIIKEMYRVTKPGGRLLIDFSNALHPISAIGSILLRRRSEWHKYSLRQIREMLSDYHYTVHIRARLSPTLWKLPVMGAIMPWLDRYVPLPLGLVSGFLCSIQRE